MSVYNTKSLSSRQVSSTSRCSGPLGVWYWECAPTYLPRVLAHLKSAALQQLPGTLHLKTPKEQGGLVGSEGWEAWGSLVPPLFLTCCGPLTPQLLLSGPQFPHCTGQFG